MEEKTLSAFLESGSSFEQTWNPLCEKFGWNWPSGSWGEDF